MLKLGSEISQGQTEKPREKGLGFLSGKPHTENKISSIPAHYRGKFKEGSERTNSILSEKGFFQSCVFDATPKLHFCVQVLWMQ